MLSASGFFIAGAIFAVAWYELRPIFWLRRWWLWPTFSYAQRREWDWQHNGGGRLSDAAHGGEWSCAGPADGVGDAFTMWDSPDRIAVDSDIDDAATAGRALARRTALRDAARAEHADERSWTDIRAHVAAELARRGKRS